MLPGNTGNQDIDAPKLSHQIHLRICQVIADDTHTLALKFLVDGIINGRRPRERRDVLHDLSAVDYYHPCTQGPSVIYKLGLRCKKSVNHRLTGVASSTNYSNHDRNWHIYFVQR